jgi:hypothetical protein
MPGHPADDSCRMQTTATAPVALPVTDRSSVPPLLYVCFASSEMSHSPDRQPVAMGTLPQNSPPRLFIQNSSFLI